MRHIIYSIFLFIFCLFCSSLTEAQCLAGQYNYARLSVLTGGNITFNFNAIDDYKNGITIANQTVLGITIGDCPSNPPTAGSDLGGWDIYFDADGVNLKGDNPANTLPLSTIEARATNRIGFAPSATTTYAAAPQPLAAIGAGNRLMGTTTVFPTTWNTHQLNITYYCGVTNKIINTNSIADFYTTNIGFVLIPRGIVFVDPFY